MRGLGKITAAFLAVTLLIDASCAREGSGSPASSSFSASPNPSDASPPSPFSPSPTESPGIPPTGLLTLRSDGLGEVSFGQPMGEVMPILIRLLGPADDSARVHGDMPLGYDGLDARARWVSFGGLRVLFGDWAAYGEGAGVMRFVGWDALERRASNGAVLVTPDGIRIGSTVADLEAAFGSVLHLPVQPRCGSPPWYWGVDPDLRFLGSLTAQPSDPTARVGSLHAGPVGEGVWVDECW